MGRSLRRWEASGRLSALHTAGGHRRYDLATFKPELIHSEPATARRTVAYAQVFSARLYGRRSHRDQKLLDGVRQAVEASQC